MIRRSEEQRRREAEEISDLEPNLVPIKKKTVTKKTATKK
jgi:hypothetical protein